MHILKLTSLWFLIFLKWIASKIFFISTWLGSKKCKIIVNLFIKLFLELKSNGWLLQDYSMISNWCKEVCIKINWRHSYWTKTNGETKNQLKCTCILFPWHFFQLKYFHLFFVYLLWTPWERTIFQVSEVTSFTSTW